MTRIKFLSTLGLKIKCNSGVRRESPASDHPAITPPPDSPLSDTGQSGELQRRAQRLRSAVFNPLTVKTGFRKYKEKHFMNKFFSSSGSGQRKTSILQNLDEPSQT